MDQINNSEESVSQSSAQYGVHVVAKPSKPKSKLILLIQNNKKFLPIIVIALAIPLTVGLALMQTNFLNRAAGLAVTPVTPPEIQTYGKAIDFTSANTTSTAYAKITNAASIGEFDNLTIEALAYYTPDSKSLDYPIVTKKFSIAQHETMPFQFGINKQGKLSFIYTVFYQDRWAATEIVSNSILSTDKYNHIAVVYNSVPGSVDQGKISLYINGKRDAEQYQTGKIGGGSRGDVTIGYGPSGFFNGVIDEVRISSIPRYLGNENYFQTQPFVQDDSTIALYKFDGNLNDSKGKYPGTAVGNLNYVNSISSPFVYPKDLVTPTPVPYIRIKNPNGGEKLKIGSTYRILWESSSDIKEVSVGYKSCETCELKVLGFVKPNIGYYDWYVKTPEGAGNLYKIYVIESSMTITRDSSDNYFSLANEPTPTPTKKPTPTPTKKPVGGKTTLPTPTLSAK